MSRIHGGLIRWRLWLALAVSLQALIPGIARAADGRGHAANQELNLGPYNASFLEDSVGLSRALSLESKAAAASLAWSMTGWITCSRRQPGTIIVAAIGNAAGRAGDEWRGLSLVDGELEAPVGHGITLSSHAALQPGRWYAVAATFDGTFARLYLDGSEVAASSASTTALDPRLELAPVSELSPPGSTMHFGGSLALLTVSTMAKTALEIRSLATMRPKFALITFNDVGVGWPLQEHAWRGLLQPQDPWTLPHSDSAPSRPTASDEPTSSQNLTLGAAPIATIKNWRLIPAPLVNASGAQLSRAQYPDRDWYAAVVPGTVLTTLIARGVYPDPDFGLNNLAIPDDLSRQDYWYRSVFVPPSRFQHRHQTLMFKGINYAAEVWLNGRRLGTIRGAFTRGAFDVTAFIVPGKRNALAVRISPPPHPGIPHEQSIMAGPGNNGGAMAIDGPTFIASEGWDWIPGIRDRNTGIWQDVELVSTGDLQMHDPHVMTKLPLPRIDTADISIVIPVENHRAVTVSGTVIARVAGISVVQSGAFKPGMNEITFDPAHYPQLHLASPRLWWPNGYGEASLYTLKIDIKTARSLSDSTSIRFGIRELTYELSLFDHDGRLRRVEVDPTLGTMNGERLIDVRHEAIKRTAQGWAQTLTAVGEASSAVRPVASESLTPYLVLRVNGVRIAARGGSWGMDDSRKRISRDRLEPYFRLHRDAHLNIIRNWLGQNTEDVFYDLADEYGLLVLNDFWISTQDFQLEPDDSALFLSNARDVISRYRNHPSIAVWFGRNEGVPPPVINEGLADLVTTLDGTRYYTGSSNSINLQGSGPYNYRPPEDYFTKLARGFSVEVGTPSLSTIEALRASIPAADLWPLNDTYAYHDWHFGGNGDVETFMMALTEQHGPASSLEDFERKAQLMNYASYRAIFEGFQAKLWTQNSGRLLWMTHPSWPSNTWQIYSSDYDTAAAYYAVKKACEPVHVQMNLPDFKLAVVNTTRDDQLQLVLHSRILSLDNRLLAERTDRVDARANSVTTLGTALGLSAPLAQEGLVLVKLTLQNSQGATLSDNAYWQGGAARDQRRLEELKPQTLRITALGHASGAGTSVTVTLTNPNAAPVVYAKITMLDGQGERVLPVYYSDNYVTLLPQESRVIDVTCPRGLRACSRVAVRGWNVVQNQVPILEE